MNWRFTLLSLAAGVQVTASTLAFRYEFCMAGDGFGLPLAIVHPGHDEPWLLPPGSNDSLAIDLLGVGANLLIFSVLVRALLWWAMRKRGLRIFCHAGDTIAEDAGTSFPVSDSHRRELDRRLEDRQRNPAAESPWSEVADRLWKR